MPTAATTSFDAQSFRRAMDERDPEMLTGLFRDDAECILIDKDHPPSNPLEKRGREEIRELNEYLLGPGKSHRVEKLLVTEDAAGFADACRYDDGTRVYCTGVMDLEDGKISRQVCVQAWDE